MRCNFTYFVQKCIYIIHINNSVIKNFIISYMINNLFKLIFYTSNQMKCICLKRLQRRHRPHLKFIYFLIILFFDYFCLETIFVFSFFFLLHHLKGKYTRADNRASYFVSFSSFVYQF